MSNMTKKNRYYVVLPSRGRKPGIYDNWPDAEAQIKHFPNGRPYGFDTYEEALKFWRTGGNPVHDQPEEYVEVHQGGNVYRFPLNGELRDFLGGSGFLPQS